MMSTIRLADAQAHLADVIHRLQQGSEIMITENNEIVARLVGERRPIKQRPGPGLAKGMMTIVADDEEHLKDFAEYMP